MILHIKGSTRKNRGFIETAAFWYAEKLMGKRLMSGLKININLKRGMLEKTGNEATAIWEDDNVRPKEFTIDIDSSANIRNLLITLAHEMVHVKQWAKDEMYEYTNMAGLVRFKGEKVHMEITEYWDYPWEIEAYGKQLGLFVRMCEAIGIAKREDMKEEA